jgi:hypothetical protein
MVPLEERIAKLKPRRIAADLDETDPRVKKLADESREFLALFKVEILARKETIESSPHRWSPRLHFPEDVLTGLVDRLGFANDRSGNERLSKHIADVLREAHWKELAGTVESREQLKQKRIAAEAAYDAREGEITPAIANMQRELRTLDRQRIDARAEEEAPNEALRQWRMLTPEVKVTQHSRRMIAIAPISTQLTEAKARLANIRGIAQIDLADLDGRRRARELAGSWQRYDLQLSAHDNYIDFAGWKRFAAELQKEIPALETNIAKLTADFEAAKADADKLLDVHVL